MEELYTNPEFTARQIMKYVAQTPIEIGNFIRRFTEKLLTRNTKAQTKSDLIELGRKLKNYVRYTNDYFGVETLKNPLGIIEDLERYGYVIGDCDDITLFGNLCLSSIGYRVGCKIIEQCGEGYFSHIYSVVNLDGEILPFDLCSPKEILKEPLDKEDITDYKIFVFRS